MDENKRLLDGLMKAMQAEVDGHNFYKMAANSADDEKGKEVFMALAQDEVEHYVFLKAQYDSFLKNGKVFSRFTLSYSRKFLSFIFVLKLKLLNSST